MLPRRLPLRYVPHLLFAIELIVLALVGRQWAYVTTYRLYLDHVAGGAPYSMVTQRFEVEGRRVIPRVVTGGHERLAFPNHILNNDATLRAELQAVKPVRYAIASRVGARRDILVAGVVAGRKAIAQTIPAGADLVELETDGAVSWIDPRLVRGMHVGRHLTALVLLAMLSWAFNRRMPLRERQQLRVAWFRCAAITIAVVTAILGCELSLRAVGDRAPAGVLAQRRDLGEVTPDERWEYTARYGQRLRAGVDTENLWRYGDIVRMGFIPATVSPGVEHRFPFKTDAEGFRNRAVRERVDVAALGDSFTDAMTVPFDASWPARLEQRTGLAVQNYGTAGFGPQQELLVLRDFVARRRPSRVVLAYFAGNDLFDAERFEHAHGPSDNPALGWQIKDVFSRADTWYVTSAISAGAAWLAGRQQPFVVTASEAQPAARDIPAKAPFDRGLFSLRVGGTLLQWAFMPPYLNTMNFSERELRGRRGWQLTRDAILAMQRASMASGSEFIVMFLPFKSQVYWPLLETSLSPADLRQALSFYLDGNGRAIDVDAMRRNRLAQNTMLRELCESAGIGFLDTTPVLQQRVESGENVYFPDESHLNERGQDLVAQTLATFLQDR